MTLRNGYITVADLKAYITSLTMATDTTDDTVMERMIEAASRALDDVCRRKFYPRIQTYTFDVDGSNELVFPDDLLRVITLTNGDESVIASTSYQLIDQNLYPKYALRLLGSSGVVFQYDDDLGDAEGAISLRAEWGYHPDYTLSGWLADTTLNGAVSSTTTTTVAFTSATNLVAGQILKVDDELMLITTAAASATVVRGWNGSTAATHTTLTQVYIWNPYEPVQQAIREIAHDAYQKRTGQVGSGAATVTGAGVVIRPAGFPQTAMDIAESLRRYP